MVRIRAFDSSMKQALLDLSLSAWAPVFPVLGEEVPGFVFDAFYPTGWQDRQLRELTTVLDEKPGAVDVAFTANEVAAGWVCTRLHPEDNMGEIYVLAVDPAFQRQGIARALMEHSFQRISEAGMRMVMVETGDDTGHAPSRATYEASGFQRWPVARYFKDLTDASRGQTSREESAE